jgi:hypothetical protein
LGQYREFGWVGGRTQNTKVLLRYSRLGRLFPFDQPYDEGTGKAVMTFLVRNIDEVREIGDGLNHKTGICQNVYPEGRLGDFRESIPEAERFERQLQVWGFQRENGDAIVAVAKLRQPIFRAGHITM